MKKGFLFITIISFLVGACVRKPENIKFVHELPYIYPDYIDVTIPVNIAPLNFILQTNPQAIEVKVIGKKDSLVIYGKNKAFFPLKEWKKILQSEDTLTVFITALEKGAWVSYIPFHWFVVNDKLDPYLSYRLIEPGYEVWNRLQLCERNIENFDVKVMADNNLLNTSCMNCHIYGNNSEDLSMFHIRGNNGGTILNRNGVLRKLALNANGMISSAVYGGFHPSGRYGVFSTNIIIPNFHSSGSQRLEVFDTNSDIVVVDFDENTILQPAVLTDSLALETFPCFSADGKTIYYCVAPRMSLPDSVKQVKYSLCSITFDDSTFTFSTQIDTLYNAQYWNKSVSFPKVSPDGKYILYTISDYGTFPIWHQEADLQLMNLETFEIDSLKIVNGKYSDTYHSWSSNSRWIVFASKRDNGLYGKPYFCYIDTFGKVNKPFLLPQKNPEYYNFTLKSFNIPELSKDPVPFNSKEIENIYNTSDAEQFQYVSQ